MTDNFAQQTRNASKDIAQTAENAVDQTGQKQTMTAEENAEQIMKAEENNATLSAEWNFLKVLEV